MTINIRWVLKNIPKQILILLLGTMVIGSFEGLVNGIVLGGFPSLVNANSGQLTRFLVMAAGLYFTTYTGLYFEQMLVNAAVKHLNIQLKATMLITSFQTGEQTSKGLNHITNDAGQIENRYFRVLSGITESSIAAVISTVFVLRVHWLMGLVFVAFSALSAIPMLLGKNRLAAIGKQWSQANDQTMQAGTDWLTGRRDIVQAAAQKTMFVPVRHALQHSERTFQRQGNLQWTIQYGALLTVILSLIGPWGIGFWLMTHGGYGITLGILLTLSLTANNAVQNIEAVMQQWGQLASTRELRNLPAQPQPFADTAAAVLPADQAAYALRQASLDYGPDHSILAPTTLTIPARAKILITGPSGIGKTSVLNLLAGWQAPTSGQVLLAGQPAAPTAVAYVAQEPWLFAGTVRDNLTLHDAAVPDAAVRQALADVQLLTELGPDPLNRQINPDSSDVSGGQKQRLVIARALLQHKSVLLLDEITAGLDDENSRAIRELLYALPLTIIESAHHLDSDLLAKYGFTEYTLHDQRLEKVNATPTAIQAVG
ncbi:ATP-binding cassette domain-containing protein [Schleiferilactobacillus harbinensis]|uniref:ATP-binding cassette domain-containing protein n=1 Tax=Schleiferilactobacillus harbinensis TaxID=304207 RepID=UPI00345E3218